MDIRDADAVESLFDGIVERHGRVDVLVNNAGGQFLSPAEAISPKGFRTVIELNVQGTWQMTHAAATKAFIPQRSGKVISVTLSPHHGMPGMVALRGRPRRGREHDAHALDRVGALRDHALRGGRRPVRHRGAAHEVPAAGCRERRSHRSPLQRLGTPEEMAWLIAYLASPAGDFLSGCVITIDGARDNWFGAWPPPASDGRVRRAARRGAPAGRLGLGIRVGRPGERGPKRVDERPAAATVAVLVRVVAGE